MLIENVLYTDADFKIKRGRILIEGFRMYVDTAFNEYPDEKLKTRSGFLVVPGFIDIHTHGGDGADTSSTDKADYEILSRYYAKHGVTSFCPTTMTCCKRELRDIFKTVADVMEHEDGAYIHGINMEGPYISQQKKGAQNGDFIRKPDLSEFSSLRKLCNISLVDVAPEVEGALEFAEYARRVCTVSAAHTAASCEKAQEAFKNGFSHTTHLYNAMTGLKAREPGVIGATLNSKVTAELICDGFHINPTVLNITFNLLGNDRPVVVSDSMPSAGCPDGEYQLGGQKVYVVDGRAQLSDGTIAASMTNMHAEFLYLLDIGIPFETALRACTINPARVIGVSDITGSIGNSMRADLLVLDEKFDIAYVIVKGKVVYQSDEICSSVI